MNLACLGNTYPATNIGKYAASFGSLSWTMRHCIGVDNLGGDVDLIIGVVSTLLSVQSRRELDFSVRQCHQCSLWWLSFESGPLAGQREPPSLYYSLVLLRLRRKWPTVGNSMYLQGLGHHQALSGG